MTNNGNMPAIPCEVVEEYHIDASQVPCGTPTLRGRKVMSGGMTKREMMAMHAPNDAPIWFEDMWEKKNWNDDDLYEDWEDEFHIEHRSITAKGKSAMYFAWRTHYADATLAELERTK